MGRDEKREIWKEDEMECHWLHCSRLASGKEGERKGGGKVVNWNHICKLQVMRNSFHICQRSGDQICIW